MAIEKKIRFKSIPELYYYQKNGFKGNTIRFTDDWDKERWLRFKNASIVKIEESVTGDTFERQISHKCLYKNIAIISW